ncbi:MAG TPA: phosphatase PAP2 family protein [Opitutaceae bacterium]|nr:phosphatase PAP2 family protein [Opitutaceae bacterium]
MIVSHMESPRDRTREAGWLRAVGARALVWWPVKMLGTAVGMTVFFVAYFWVLNHPIFPVTMMPMTAIDRAIAFRPESLALYFSLWVYVSLVPGLLIDRRELVSFGVAALVLSVVGLGIFLLWPTAVPRLEVDWSRYPSFSFLHSVDASGNACPSLHVAFAVFTAFWIARILRQLSAGRIARILNWLWCLGILYSTIATRQHVILDVLAGAMLGAVVAVLHLRWVGNGTSQSTREQSRA